ncbi:MAG TPA: UDP-N-acetylenolpyruvoylglucosamine reductase [Planctomycetaceae bacterium]|nr:UDP-N-acetylenolpyruvoylglucosamine reductase [Blastopirellula sp.]HAY81053.1 UDP-N-acetylenolpyruvoylglucosamine reductase [Planctomycetaceae bacterium]
MELFDGLEHVVRENESLAPYTWFRLGGAAQYFAEPTTVDELSLLVQRSYEHDVPVRLIGGGSNVLVPDAGVEGLVLHLSAPAFAEIGVTDNQVTAGGGAKLSHVISTSVREGLGGLEQMVGVPGTVGGALHGNAGTQGGDIGQWTRRARVMTRAGEIRTHETDSLNFAYRRSSLDELVILDATFELEQGDSKQLTKRMQTLWIIKKSKQPKTTENTCAVFRDPGGVDAASLIEQAGLKGTEVGQASVSERNANFIVAQPGATSQSVVELIAKIKAQVFDRTGVELEPTLNIW